mmetsp:Transcript_11222/g.26785  ORF Transcript_11222/g.26785 Transcript_11222/m.26785 type:complete len:255 (-) Transcript_11222:1882-2646(-)
MKPRTLRQLQLHVVLVVTPLFRLDVLVVRLHSVCFSRQRPGFIGLGLEFFVVLLIETLVLHRHFLLPVLGILLLLSHALLNVGQVLRSLHNLHNSLLRVRHPEHRVLLRRLVLLLRLSLVVPDGERIHHLLHLLHLVLVHPRHVLLDVLLGLAPQAQSLLHALLQPWSVLRFPLSLQHGSKFRFHALQLLLQRLQVRLMSIVVQPLPSGVQRLRQLLSTIRGGNSLQALTLQLLPRLVDVPLQGVPGGVNILDL